MEQDKESYYNYLHNEYYDKFKKYKSRDEFINDDGLTDDEKVDICENLIESLELERGE